MALITTKEFRAIAYLIGITIGAGVLALPYVFSQAGFLIGIVELTFVWVLVTLITLYLAEVVLRTKGDHEVSGLTEIYLGKKGKTLIVAVSILYIYGALIAYGVGLGEAFASLFGFAQKQSTMVVFLILAVIVYAGLNAVTRAEVLLTPLIFLIIAAIGVTGYQQITVDNYFTMVPHEFLLPFGPLFFSLLGFWCVPDMKRILGKGNEKNLRKTILLGTSLTAAAYLLFTFVVVGVTGTETSELFSVALSTYLGPVITKIMHIFTIFAIITSFLGLGFTLKAIFTIDYKMSNNKAFVATFLVPLLLLFVIKGGFIDVITVTGAVASVFVLLMLVLMFHKAKTMGKRKPEFSLHVPLWINVLLILSAVVIAVTTVIEYGARLF